MSEPKQHAEYKLWREGESIIIPKPNPYSVFPCTKILNNKFTHPESDNPRIFHVRSIFPWLHGYGGQSFCIAIGLQSVTYSYRQIEISSIHVSGDLTYCEHSFTVILDSAGSQTQKG